MDRWRGSVTVAHWRTVPIRLHASLPIGLLWFSRLHFAPGLWAGVLLLVLAHELGHAALVLAHRAKPLEVVLHGFGGECSWSGTVSPLGRAVIASGGVAAQLVVYVLVREYLRAFPPGHEFTGEIAFVLGGWTNLEMIALNLIPIRPLDGAEVWKGVPLLFAKLQPSRAERTAMRNASLGAGNAETLKRVDREAEEIPPDVAKLVDRILDDAKK